MSKRHLTEIEALLYYPDGTPHDSIWLPSEQILALPDFWQLVPEGEYCPLSFDPEFGVPNEFNESRPVVEHDGFMFVFGHDGEQGFYYKLTNRVSTRYDSLADAVGAFVAGELRACIADPSRMLLDAMLDGQPTQRVTAGFDLFKFEEHLSGLLSDLVYLCSENAENGWPLAVDFKGPVTLIVVRTAGGTDWPDDKHEWQGCAQGHARIEAA